ncbi:Acyl-CoA hydrolase [Halalkaliarchaeum sp. AArc-CO]|uniref:acyl-CoA thioesterase n=1 Tax=unclassified Halalkaliarchaeum TaxID=2678344 RepID=UPI00217EE2AC|nr:MULTISPECIES: acyl-CoA thioesterase [unclassified Halalkaliarchaeum]MDR5672524.1 acyl-CoA thioesterase [Halalkaliarchaeum sp. AArc-GB]UWG50526.1 Acyl-CoA hydrolase [Halalkaliarchaeum sp. AArc-CO]
MPTLLDTYLENRSRIQPNHTNNYGMAHGGNVMKWMDEVGAMSAMRFAGQTCVTASIEGMDFEKPVPQGDTVLIHSYVYAAGRTSVRVRLQAYREHPRTGEIERTTESYFVFVAIDEDRTPVSVPELAVKTEKGRRLRDEAIEGESHH